MLLLLFLLLLLPSAECVNLLKKTLKLLKPNRTVTAPGAWSEWGSWDENCSATCGIGYRRRVRTCSYAGRKRRLRCRGDAGQLKNCDTLLTCPVHGGWAQWVAWDCSASCGGGVGLQKRTCTNPKPMFGGRGCEGPSEEDGKCNVQKCADQVYTLSPATARDLKDATEKVHHDFQLQEGTDIHLTCDPKVVAEVLLEYPSSALFWTRNGRLLTVDVSRTEVGLTGLRVSGARPEDGGVYLCSMRYAPGVVRTVSAAAVSVRPGRPTATPRQGEPLRLECRGSQLSVLYRNLSQSWWLGKQLQAESGCVEQDVYVIEEAMPNMTGMWSCKIRDPERGWTWTTNKVSVKVLPPVPLYLRLLQDTSFWFGLLTFALLALMTLGMFFGYKITKARENFLDDFEKWCHIARAECDRMVESEGEDDLSESSEEDFFVPLGP